MDYRLCGNDRVRFTGGIKDVRHISFFKARAPSYELYYPNPHLPL
ncbi:unnamed protein product, partial [marine sediment metagenome]